MSDENDVEIIGSPDFEKGDRVQLPATGQTGTVRRTEPWIPEDEHHGDFDIFVEFDRSDHEFRYLESSLEPIQR